jgi:hypothetical protein
MTKLKQSVNLPQTVEVDIPLPHYFKTNEYVEEIRRISELNGNVVETKLCIQENFATMVHNSAFSVIPISAVPITIAEYAEAMDKVLQMIEKQMIEIENEDSVDILTNARKETV